MRFTPSADTLKLKLLALTRSNWADRLTPLITPAKTNLLLGSALNEPAGNVTLYGPICSVTSSVRGLTPLLAAPNVINSFRSKPEGGPAVIVSFASAEANGTVVLLETIARLWVPGSLGSSATLFRLVT